VRTFERAIHEATEIFPATPDDTASAPTWDRVAAEMPDFLPALRDAAAADARVRGKMN